MFIEKLQQCAEGEEAIHNRGACGQTGSGVLGMSASHEVKNSNPFGCSLLDFSVF